jgi:hypothetical protein
VLSNDQRRYVIESAVDLLRHHRRGRVLEILEQRIAREDYPQGLEEERDLDRIALAIARAVERELGEDRDL